ncbi:hypothetical protein [Methylogaea oryzae]|uniref:hypothetical protein n=1 Tax=Methylogaea oryzae TaxID=1295382 RepID=UPI0006D1DCEC|nr:hypothetical protein [Methylogaea oryzae]
MSALTFTLKIAPQQRVDVAPLTPDNLAGKSAADIAALALQCGNRTLRADEVSPSKATTPAKSASPSPAPSWTTSAKA